MAAHQVADTGGQVKRIGMVIGARPETLDYYRELHADTNPGVRDLLAQYHIRNFSIFVHRLPDDREYLFAYYEYVGNDYDADLARLAAEPRNQAWLALCDPCQIPLAGATSWSVMEKVYFNP